MTKLILAFRNFANAPKNSTAHFQLKIMSVQRFYGKGSQPLLCAGSRPQDEKSH